MRHPCPPFAVLCDARSGEEMTFPLGTILGIFSLYLLFQVLEWIEKLRTDRLLRKGMKCAQRMGLIREDLQ